MTTISHNAGPRGSIQLRRRALDIKEEPMRKYEYQLPYPPSVNHTWRHKGGQFYVSPKTKTYRADVLAAVWSQGKPPQLECPLTVHLYVTPPDKRVRDLDNIFKVVLDALAKAGVYVDDSQIVELKAKREAVTKPGGVWVRVFAE
jgi:crossover junction endodeoxyribonuclease RusA